MALNARIPNRTAEMPATGTEPGAIRFGVFEVDPRSGELRRNGIRVKLQEQPFQILLTLLEHPGEVVTREELRSRLWAEDTYVDFDHSLNAAVRRLRDALADSAENPRFVETVARRGYRFLAPVNGAVAANTSQPVPATSARRFWVPLTIAVLLAGVVLGLIIARTRRQSGQSTSAQIKQRRLTASSEENPVLGAAISPDGKYLAFADKTGVSLRQVDSGETHL
jgi:DNA-binding winged helix-turn-helix (wHTH) protein